LSDGLVGPAAFARSAYSCTCSITFEDASYLDEILAASGGATSVAISFEGKVIHSGNSQQHGIAASILTGLTVTATNGGYTEVTATWVARVSSAADAVMADVHTVAAAAGSTPTVVQRPRSYRITSGAYTPAAGAENLLYVQSWTMNMSANLLSAYGDGDLGYTFQAISGWNLSGTISLLDQQAPTVATDVTALPLALLQGLRGSLAVVLKDDPEGATSTTITLANIEFHNGSSGWTAGGMSTVNMDWTAFWQNGATIYSLATMVTATSA